MVSLLLVLLLTATPAKEPAKERVELPPVRVFTPQAIDRAVYRLDLRQERAVFVAGHPESPLPGVLPAYADEITVEDRARELTPEIREYKTLPFTGIGGRQGPAYDKHTGIPWWF